MKSHKAITSITYLIAIILAGFLIKTNASAVTCNDIKNNNPYNPSIEFACDNNYGGGQRTGAMWVTGEDGSREAKITIKNISNDEVVYVCGAALWGNDYSGMIADNIKFVKAKIGPSNNHGADGYAPFAYLDFSSKELNRPGNPSPYSNDIKVSCKSAKFKVKDFIEKGEYGYTTDSATGNRIYNLTLNIFRCPNCGNSCGSSQCWSDGSDVQIIIPSTLLKPSFLSISHVRADSEYEKTGIVAENTTANTDPVYVKKGDSIDLVFSHNIYTSGSKQDGVNWEISSNFNRQGGGAGYSFDSKILGPEDGKGTSNINKQAIWLSNLYEPETLPYTDGSYKYLARDEYEVTFTEVNTSGYEFCETISVTNFEAPSTTACATIIVTEDGLPPSPNPPSPGEETSGDKLCAELPIEETAGSEQYVNSNKVPEDLTSFQSSFRTLQSAYSTYYQYINCSNQRWNEERYNQCVEKKNKAKAAYDTAAELFNQYDQYCKAKFSNPNKCGSIYNWTNAVTIMLNYVNADGSFRNNEFIRSCDSNRNYNIGRLKRLECQNDESMENYFRYDYYIDSSDGNRFKFDNLDFVSLYSNKIGKNNSTFSESDRTYVKSLVTNPNNKASDGWAISNAKGKNEEGKQFYDEGFANEQKVFAKPGDIINWLHCYYPNVQKLANLEITEKDGGHPHSSTANDNLILSDYYNKYYKPKKWQNKYSVTQLNLPKRETLLFPTTNNTDLYYSSGDYTPRGWLDEDYVIKKGKNSSTGMSLFEKIESGGPIKVQTHEEYHVWTWTETHSCGSDCTYTEVHVENHTNDFRKIDSIEHGPDSDQAMVQVPYNFTNTASIQINGNFPDDWRGEGVKEDEDNNNVVYAGDTITLNELEVRVDPKPNKYVDSSDIWGDGKGDLGYATKVDNAEVRMYAFTSKDKVDQDNNRNIKGYIDSDMTFCDELNDKLSNKSLSDYKCSKINDVKDENNIEGLVLNSKEKLTGRIFKFDSKNIINNLIDGEKFNINKLGGSQYKVFDAPAGEYFCVAIAVYPAETIGVDLKGNNGKAPWANNNNYSWNVSSHCLKIAKKPSFEIWGGNMYSTGKVETYISGKNVIKDVEGYKYPGSNSKVTFGSWAELGIIANGEIKELASGASLGAWGDNSNNYTSDVPQNLPQPNAGGSLDDSFCKRVPLTIPNTQYIDDNECKDGGSVNKSNTKVTNSPTDKNAIIKRFFVLNEDGTSTDKCATGVDSCYDSSIVNNANITQDLNNNKKVITWYHNGDIEINDSIITETEAEIESKTFKSLQDIPKIIIYATKNINISCNVERIDAVLIADDGTVNTCAGATTDQTPAKYNGSNRMNRLKINGTVIAKSIVLGRTYGAATGVNSGAPAEIINYDTSLYLWGRNQASSITSGKFNTLTTYELAPRY